MAQEKIIIITAPSGAGKTSITQHLIQQFPQLSFSVSAATRNSRGNEKHGVDYFFVSVEEFKQKINENAFAEWEMVYEGKYYGTLKSELKKIWSNNKVPILDIDVKGAIHIQQEYIGKTLSLFIKPPNIETLKKRLESRGTETAESIATRINKATYEISFSSSFDKVILNSDLQLACKEAEDTVKEFLK